MSDYIDKLQCEITQQYLLGNSAQGNTLASVRTDVIKIISEGDLGENHTQLYIEDHPIVIGTDYRVLPFYNFCESALEIKNPIILLGFLMRNEEGSLEEAIALAETGLIGKGAFADKHLIEEKEHGRIAESVTKKLLAEPAYAEDFKTGMKVFMLHIVCYNLRKSSDELKCFKVIHETIVKNRVKRVTYTGLLNKI